MMGTDHLPQYMLKQPTSNTGSRETTQCPWHDLKVITIFRLQVCKKTFYTIPKSKITQDTHSKLLI